MCRPSPGRRGRRPDRIRRRPAPAGHGEEPAIAGPQLNQTLWKISYEFLASRLPYAEWGFMNYGWTHLPPGQDTLALDPADEPDRYCIQLYDRVASAVDLRGRDVLEIGSGRGGGASYIKRYLGPAMMVGADLSLQAVRLCNRHRAFPGLVYVRGDAQALRFPDETFDAVVNVESSHCYPSMDTFVSEARRVLRPGGHLLFADFRPAEQLPRLHRQLTRTMELVEHEVITPNVVAALERDSERKARLIREMVPAWLQRPFSRFAGIQGSHTHEGFATGRTEYVRYAVRKPDRRG